MAFEVPERLRETLVTSSIAPDAALAMAHPPEKEFVDPTDWKTEFFSELEHDKIFSSPGALQSLPRETRTPFTTPVKDLASLALTEKKDALEGLFFSSPGPSSPTTNNMRGRTVVVVSKVLQNIGSFRKGMLKELWNMPNAVLRYGSFNPTKRAEGLTRAGELVLQ